MKTAGIKLVEGIVLGIGLIIASEGMRLIHLHW